MSILVRCSFAAFGGSCAPVLNHCRKPPNMWLGGMAPSEWLGGMAPSEWLGGGAPVVGGYPAGGILSMVLKMDSWVLTSFLWMCILSIG